LFPVIGIVETNTPVSTIEETVQNFSTQVHKIEETIQRIERVVLYVPSNETRETRDDKYIKKIEESDELVEEIDVKDEIIEETLRKIYMESNTNSKVRELFKLLLLMEIGEEDG